MSFDSTKELDWLCSTCPNIKVLLLHNLVDGMTVEHLARFPNLEILDVHGAQFASLQYFRCYGNNFKKQRNM